MLQRGTRHGTSSTRHGSGVPGVVDGGYQYQYSMEATTPGPTKPGLISFDSGVNLEVRS